MMEQITTTADANIDVGMTREASGLEDFDLLMRAEQQRIYRILLAMLPDPDTAESLTQECFFKAYKQRGGFRGECSLRTWLVRIAVNLTRDHLRNRRWQFWRKVADSPLRDPDAITHPQASPERALLAQEELAAVWSAVHQLPPRQRTIFALRFIEDMTIEEIAESTSLRPGTVKAHLFRAVGALRRSRQERKKP